MKRKIFVICLAFLMCINVVNATELPEVTDHEVVKVYVFWWTSCSACEALIGYLNDVEETYEDYFEIVTLSITDGSNDALLDEVKLEYEDSNSVPYTVVGENYVIGSGISSIIEYALEEYQNEEYVDVVGNLIDNGSGYEIEDLEYACDIKGIEYWNPTEKDSSTEGYVVAAMLIVVVGALGYLIFSPKKV